jgi:hypothetical protein
MDPTGVYKIFGEHQGKTIRQLWPTQIDLRAKILKNRRVWPRKMYGQFRTKFEICLKFKIRQAKVTKQRVVNYFWLAGFKFKTQ